MLNEVYNDTKERMNKSIKVLKKELSSLRTGRASAAIFDNIKIDYYGQKNPLNQVAGINIPEPRSIVIKPWDKSLIEVIKKAILASDIGITPLDDGNVIRLNIPPLTEESRKKIVKVVKTKGEDTKISIRNIRRDSNSTLQDMEKESMITEDAYHKSLTEIQKITDDCIKAVEEVVNRKEKEILED